MNRLKQNRAASFAVIALVYIFAAVCGVAVYNMLRFDWRMNLLLADVAATAVVFLFSVIFDNASVYDPYWSVQPIVIVLAFAVGKELTPVRILLLAAVIFWGVRLTLNWAYTFSDLEHQDWRYTMLKEKTGVLYPFVNLFGIHMMPTLIVYACTVPAVYAFIYDCELNAGSIIFFCVTVGAVI